MTRQNKKKHNHVDTRSDARFITPVVDTLMNTFSTMVQVSPRMGKTRIKQDDIAKGDVTGMLKMEGDKASGSVSITFTKPVVIDLVKRMLNMDIHEIDEIARDLAGEMANIVVGGAKNLLEAQGYQINMSLPQIFAGAGHHIKHCFNGQTVEIPFSIAAGDFFIEVNFKEQS